jgi:hypothetical protein
MVGERSARDAVTLGRQAKGHWLGDALFFDPGRWPLPTASISSVRDTPSRLFSTTQPPFRHGIGRRSCFGADYYQQVELLSRHTWRKAYYT